jgi:hypothetical protein
VTEERRFTEEEVAEITERRRAGAFTRQRHMDEIAETMESQSLVMMNSGAPSNS